MTAQTLAMVRDALRARRVMMAYQPVVMGADPTLIAFHEGLVRVLDETGRIIPARDFMGAVETTELGRLIDCASLELGLDALVREPGLRLAVNMSARSIGYARWTETLRRGLAASPTVAERLILEITESSAMLVPEIVATFMADLQRKGISFALDDFGAGFTAFRHFKEFYFDIVKIDGQFIRGVAQRPGQSGADAGADHDRAAVRHVHCGRVGRDGGGCRLAARPRGGLPSGLSVRAADDAARLAAQRGAEAGLTLRHDRVAGAVAVAACA